MYEDWETEGRIHAYNLENRPYTEEELDLLLDGELNDYWDDDDDDCEVVKNLAEVPW